MAKPTGGIWFLGTGLILTIAVLFSGGIGGCSRKEPPVSKEALSLKKEIKEKIEKYSTAFVEPLSKGDKAAVQEALGKLSIELTQDGQPLTWGAAVLNKDAVVLGAFTSIGPQAGLDYSNIKPVVDAIKNREMVQGKFYGQDGFCAYYVVKPLVRQGELVGLFVLGLSAKELTDKKRVSEKEFMAIDFKE
jgi:hypothetical protein